MTKDNTYSAGGDRTYRMPAGDRVAADDGTRKRVSTTIMVQNPWLTTQRLGNEAPAGHRHYCGFLMLLVLTMLAVGLAARQNDGTNDRGHQCAFRSLALG